MSSGAWGQGIRVRAAISGVFAAFTVAACAGARAPEGDVCASSQRAALERVEKVASNNQTCTEDADCAFLEMHTTCFDVCYRAVNQAGKGAVDRAETLVEASECKTFHAHACKLDVPPCMPPTGPARCVDGRCGG